MTHISNRQLFLRHLAQTSDFPMMVEVESANGIYLYSPEGQKYIDFISGIGVSVLGHNHPEVVDAVVAQAKKHMHVMVYGEFIQSPQVELAHALSGTLPKSLDSVFLVNSGSEAAEGAIKLARRFTGRQEIVSCTNAYHGATLGALSLGSREDFKRPFRPLAPGIRHIRFGSEADLEQITNETAAVFVETVQGEAGIRFASKTWYENLRFRCDETGALLVLDEIQCGFGRTGRFWAFEHFGIAPDILLTAKGLGGGMPIGAFIASSEIMSTLRTKPVLGHITTFGGHPVSAAAACATIQVLQKEDYIEQASHKAAIVTQMLEHPAIREIRHLGLMMAVQFDAFDQVEKIIHQALSNGLITDWFLFCDNAIRIAPPLIISEEELAVAVELLLKSIRQAL
jgi:acetylornithine/succinyldiaminopimelate/putrescine aminotransferase